MSTIPHQNIPDAQLHEPKGIANASAGDILVADGAGSGSWTALQAPTQVTVTSVSDFPTPVAGVITLAASTSYLISGQVDIGSNRFQSSFGTGLYGNNPLVDTITTSTTGALFSGAGIRMRSISLSAPNGSIFNMSGSGGTILDNVLVTAAVDLGTIDQTLLFVWNNANISGVTNNGLVFTGASGSAILTLTNHIDVEGTGIDFGTSVFDLIHLDQVRIGVNAGAVGINKASNGGNISASGQGYISKTFVDGLGTASTGMLAKDTEWIFSENIGVPNSVTLASGHIMGNTEPTTFAGTGTPQIVNLDSSFVADEQSRFTVSNTGRFTFNGKTTTSVSAAANIFADVAGGSNRAYRFYWAKNGEELLASVSENEYDGSNPGACSCNAAIDMDTDDYLELWVEAVTDTTNLTLETASLSVRGS